MANNPDIQDKTNHRPHGHVNPTLLKAWDRAQSVQLTADYKPSANELLVYEALLAGATTPAQLAQFTTLPAPEIRQILSSPNAMAWISSRLHEMLSLSVGIVDAALFLRAASGDVNASRLFFERHKFLERSTAPQVNIRLDNLPTEDLLALIEQRRTRVLDVKSNSPVNE